jgi:hypothetical protein
VPLESNRKRHRHPFEHVSSQAKPQQDAGYAPHFFHGSKGDYGGRDLGAAPLPIASPKTPVCLLQKMSS